LSVLYILRYSNHKDAEFCINCLAFGSHTDRNDVFTGLGFRDWKNVAGLKRGIQCCSVTVKQDLPEKDQESLRVITFASNFFGMWFYRKIEDFTFV
jgi:hypothetical protein